MYLQLVSGIKDRTIQESLQTLDKVVIDPGELAHWTLLVETTAKSMRDDNSDNIRFEYYSHEKIMKFFVKDAQPRDNLVRLIQIHLPLIPESFQKSFLCVQI